MKRLLFVLCTLAFALPAYAQMPVASQQPRVTVDLRQHRILSDIVSEIESKAHMGITVNYGAGCEQSSQIDVGVRYPDWPALEILRQAAGRIRCRVDGSKYPVIILSKVQPGTLAEASLPAAPATPPPVVARRSEPVQDESPAEPGFGVERGNPRMTGNILDYMPAPARYVPTTSPTPYNGSILSSIGLSDGYSPGLIYPGEIVYPRSAPLGVRGSVGIGSGIWYDGGYIDQMMIQRIVDMDRYGALRFKKGKELFMSQVEIYSCGRFQAQADEANNVWDQLLILPIDCPAVTFRYVNDRNEDWEVEIPIQVLPMRVQSSKNITLTPEMFERARVRKRLQRYDLIEQPDGSYAKVLR